MATDPICGMSVPVGPGALRLLRDNRTYYFCCTDCLRAFAAPEENRRRLLHRLEVAWPLSVVTVVLTWAPPFPRADVVAGALAAVVQVYAGSGFYAGAWDAIRHRIGNMDLLIAAGTTAAFAYSVAVLALPGVLPAATYFDASALIVTVILTGNYAEQATRRRAGSALRRLAELLPATATLMENGAGRSVRVDELRPGQRLRVPPGDRFPVDGLVREGRSAVDESLLTGEGRTVRKGPGDRVLAGATNVEGPLIVEAVSLGADTFVAHVGELLQDAELARVPLQREADRLAAVFVPAVLGLAIVSGTLWFFLSGGSPSIGILVFVTVAVTACPCAFGLATPAALLVGSGRAAEDGILFRGGDSIERAATVDTVLLDKTGTLTSSQPDVEGILALAPHTEAEILELAAGLEGGIRHPLAQALERAATARGIRAASVSHVALEPGRGVVGVVGGRPVAVVRGDAVEAETLDRVPLADWIRSAERRGSSWSLVVRDGRPVGALAFAAPVAAGAAEAVAELRAEGVRVAMVTGDNERAARAVAAPLGIEDVRAGVTPERKVELVRAYRREGGRVAFVGDGINDAAALAAADLGIALGSGSQVARETGAVLLVRADLLGVPRALRYARRIVRCVRENLLWAVGYNAVLLPIAAGAFVPVLGLGVYRVLPVLGAVAMGLSSTSVLLRSLTLRVADGPWGDGGHAGPRDRRSGARPEAV